MQAICPAAPISPPPRWHPPSSGLRAAIPPVRDARLCARIRCDCGCSPERRGDISQDHARDRRDKPIAQLRRQRQIPPPSWPRQGDARLADARASRRRRLASRGRSAFLLSPSCPDEILKKLTRKVELSVDRSIEFG